MVPAPHRPRHAVRERFAVAVTGAAALARAQARAVLIERERAAATFAARLADVLLDQARQRSCWQR